MNAERRLRFPAPLPVPPMTILPPPDGIYTTDSLTVPFPLNIAPLLQREHRSRHWALVLGHIYAHETILGYAPRQLAAAWRLRDLLGLNSRNPLAIRYVRLLVPVASCPHCGEQFLQESTKRVMCSNRCRRLEALPGHGIGLPAVWPPCAICSTPLPPKRRTYCCKDCHQAGRRAQQTAKRAAAKCEDQKGNQQ